MLFQEIFPNLSSEQITATLKNYNIILPDYYSFSENNIVIGPNGSGKTRFLKTVKELYLKDPSKDVVYGYFPSLSDHLLAADHTTLPQVTLYESMYTDGVTFEDFFKEIEKHHSDFIPSALKYYSQLQQQRSERALYLLCKSFNAITGKGLCFENNVPYLKYASGKKSALRDEIVNFSPGELMLFYMSIFLTILNNDRTNKVIILDELETHLHPKALLEFVKLLRQTNNIERIWIATHSLFLVPEFKFSDIVYINDSRIVSRTSSLYQSLLSDMLGFDGEKNQAFFSSLYQWQYCSYISECFVDPKIIDTVNSNDEQVLLFKKYFEENKPKHILDFGGGSGRLGLSLSVASQNRNMADFDYDIYDKSPCYNGTSFGVYTELSSINKKYDCIVMMNFLHEIDPKEWQDIFNRVYELMSENAFLLFVEVAVLTEGEYPNEVGYLVLSKSDIQILFQINSPTELRIKDNQKSIGILIPKEYLKKVTLASIKETIRHLRDRTYEEIKSYRVEFQNYKRRQGETKESIPSPDESIDYKRVPGGLTPRLSEFKPQPRYYAFLLQQYTNARILYDIIRNCRTPNSISRKRKKTSTTRVKQTGIIQETSVSALHAANANNQQMKEYILRIIILLKTRQDKLSKQE